MFCPSAKACSGDHSAVDPKAVLVPKIATKAVTATTATTSAPLRAEYMSGLTPAQLFSIESKNSGTLKKHRSCETAPSVKERGEAWNSL